MGMKYRRKTLPDFFQKVGRLSARGVVGDIEEGRNDMEHNWIVGLSLEEDGKKGEHAAPKVDAGCLKHC